MLSKIAQLDSADSTTYLTSAMKGYNIAANDVVGIVDCLLLWICQRQDPPEGLLKECPE